MCRVLLCIIAAEIIVENTQVNTDALVFVPSWHLEASSKKAWHGSEMLVVCLFTEFLLVQHIHHIYVIWDALSFRKQQITLFYPRPPEFYVQHCRVFIYDQHESNAEESPVTFGHCLIIFLWFNSCTFPGIYLNSDLLTSFAIYIYSTLPQETEN